MRVALQLPSVVERLKIGISDVEQIVQELYEAAYREGYSDGKEDAHRENCEPMDGEEE